MKIKTKNFNMNMPTVPTKAILKQVRDDALQEAVDICKSWKDELEKDFKRNSRSGDFGDFGRVNLLDLCIQRIREKIEGLRKMN